MRFKYIFIVFVFAYSNTRAQQLFLVFPKSHKSNPGKAIGDGSITNPWDLQTALYQKIDIVNEDDIIYLHEGIYDGSYLSTLNCTTLL